MPWFRISPIAVAMIALALSSSCAPSSADPASEAKADAVIQRTKLARTTYSVYVWNLLTPLGGTDREEWAAEFNSGPLHRVETPGVRIVANCDTVTGEHVVVATGEKGSGSGDAQTACGISTRVPFRSKAWLGEVMTPFGKADRVRVSDGELVRTYDIDKDGVILRAEFDTDNLLHKRVLLGVTVARPNAVPEEDIYDGDSLLRSFTPPQYKKPPAQPLSSDWPGRS